MSLRRFCIALLIFATTICGTYGQQVSPRIAGLESNESYMSILREDAQLQMREDSLMTVVSDMRRQFRENPDRHEEITRDILTLEEQMFGLRNSRGRLTDRITTIEQEWVVSNLGARPSESSLQFDLLPIIPEAKKMRNLVCNDYFRDELADSDYIALRRAQQQELVAVDYINRYISNYREIADLAVRYASAPTEREALEIFGRYKTMQGLNNVLADSLSAVWNPIFDNKTYAYGYLLDKLGQDEILIREENFLSAVERKITENRDQYASDALVDYVLRKPIVVDYEIQVASLLKLDAARDSLRGVADQLKQADYRLPKIEVAERSFIDYAPVVFTSPSKYTTSNPIPECKIFKQGTVYRVQVGTFSNKRPISVFKGIYPLCYQIDEQNKWRYFAGAFVSESEADEALKKLKAKGFVKPQIVVWRDGVYRNLATDPEQTAIVYRIEIGGVASLPDAVKSVIAASGYELSRAGQLFVLGQFGERLMADKIADAIRGADGSLEIKVTEMAENSK